MLEFLMFLVEKQLEKCFTSCLVKWQYVKASISLPLKGDMSDLFISYLSAIYQIF